LRVADGSNSSVLFLFSSLIRSLSFLVVPCSDVPSFDPTGKVLVSSIPVSSHLDPSSLFLHIMPLSKTKEDALAGES